MSNNSKPYGQVHSECSVLQSDDDFRKCCQTAINDAALPNGSQLVSQCQAYLKLGEANWREVIMLALDSLAAAACTAECAVNAGSFAGIAVSEATMETIGTSCQIAAGVDMATELVFSLILGEQEFFSPQTLMSVGMLTMMMR